MLLSTLPGIPQPGQPIPGFDNGIEEYLKYDTPCDLDGYPEKIHSTLSRAACQEFI